MTGVWEGHGVLLAHYDDPVRSSPGKHVDPIVVSGYELPVIATPSGADVAVLACEDGRFFEVAVVETPTVVARSKMDADLTTELALQFSESAKCLSP